MKKIVLSLDVSKRILSLELSFPIACFILIRAGTVWVTFMSGLPGTAERRMIAIATDMPPVCGPSASTVPLTMARMPTTTRAVLVP